VQIVPREVQQTTEQSHYFYKMGRDARDAGKTALSRHYFDQAEAINERALARFRLRNKSASRRHSAT
jgi:RNase P subunit RPR2